MTAGSVAAFLAAFGDLRLALTGTALAAGFLVLHGDRDIAVRFALGIVLCVVTTVAVKLAGLALERQSVTGLLESPSGHTALATAFVGSIALLLGHNRGAAGRRAAVAFAALLVLAIAYSRVAIDAHTCLEAGAGALVGLVSLLPLSLLLWRRSATQSSAAVPAWPLLLILAALPGVAAAVPLPDLDTESLIRLAATFFPTGH